ncbi:hypothetical protein SAY87_031741 [Trapa incisa]|uniref:Uncharacterized protein n=1 Tax=Trapa incisa TaxID=236973 RepID=A0AAN7KTW0_9MYRT|nr:hypothetical protein SAY87_031741 [Trapa incisa]
MREGTRAAQDADGGNGFQSIVISLVDKAEALVGLSTGTLREAVQGLLHLTSQSIESHEGFRFMLGSQLVDGFGQVVYAWKAVWLSLLDRYPAFVGLSRHLVNRSLN